MSMFLELAYRPLGNPIGDEPTPKLINFRAVNFTENLIVLSLNFSDPLYVSSSTKSDLLSIKFLANKLFLSKLDLVKLEASYEIFNIEVPP